MSLSLNLLPILNYIINIQFILIGSLCRDMVINVIVLIDVL